MIPDELLNYLAGKYQRARSYIDTAKFPFHQWAAMEAERMGWKL